MFSAPGYVETFSAELTIPVTRDPALAQRVSTLGRRLLWLHTYGERFVPDGKKLWPAEPTALNPLGFTRTTISPR